MTERLKAKVGEIIKANELLSATSRMLNKRTLFGRTGVEEMTRTTSAFTQICPSCGGGQLTLPSIALSGEMLAISFFSFAFSSSRFICRISLCSGQ